MMRNLLWRGMLAGLVAACVAAAFALVFAEPRIDAAIALEHHGHEVELVSRATQRTWGLLTAMTLYGTALGGLFAIVFAGLHGRVGRWSPRALALALAVAAFVVIVLVPALKYPPTPPAVGLHETVRMRTAAFFAMLALSVLAAVGAAWSYRRLSARCGRIDAALIAGAIYVVAVAVAQMALPMVDEVPGNFPATLLWRFRLAAIATQGVFWIVVADVFGRGAERLLAAPR